MSPGTLRVPLLECDAERHGMHSHAERGNDQKQISRGPGQPAIRTETPDDRSAATCHSSASARSGSSRFPLAPPQCP
ncbi:hypothetical protein CVG87_09440 [Pseudomonas sp. WCS365]|uniref:DUF1534 domain-containing protein n=1 Tax=Pseudomonas ogarae (strain DSM 112162 / CECT 30235 / F113) TaxID=1114970 RepID=A0ABM6R3W8_PSEO1|nr:hypothetical protein C1C98_20075 [Pseudomonas ogarae]PJH89749.1 hypothetical protein CVG87_09440 [Pseudomonas sp. WCS365]